MKEVTPLLIGIAGGTASGKTTFTEKLVSRLAPNSVMISHDRYYYSQDGKSASEKEQTNYDHPDSLDTNLLITHLQQLLKGHPIEAPMYDFAHHTRSNETSIIEPVEFIIVEGILVLSSKKLAELFAITVFVDADPEVRFGRRILRDIQQRGRTPEFVVHQYLSSVKPMYDQFVAPTKDRADRVINGEADTEDAMESLLSEIHSKKARER